MRFFTNYCEGVISSHTFRKNSFSTFTLSLSSAAEQSERSKRKKGLLTVGWCGNACEHWSYVSEKHGTAIFKI